MYVGLSSTFFKSSGAPIMCVATWATTQKLPQILVQQDILISQHLPHHTATLSSFINFSTIKLIYSSKDCIGVTLSMGQNPPSEADSQSAGQDIPLLFTNSTIGPYLLPDEPSPYSVFKIRFSIPPIGFQVSQLFLVSKFYVQNFLCISHLFLHVTWRSHNW